MRGGAEHSGRVTLMEGEGVLIIRDVRENSLHNIKLRVFLSVS